jgi:Flp pilus assembly CpaE family ATPase
MRSRVIAIAGAKGSPGCSFLAVALARCLVANGIPTLLLDGDAEGGGLAALLDASPTVPALTLDGDGIGQSKLRLEERLWFVELSHGIAGPTSGFELAASARLLHQAVVVDLGHAPGPVQRQLSAASDWLLWVVVPDRIGLERADSALEAGALSAARVGLVFNRIGRASLDGAEEALANRHQLPVVARIKEDWRMADRLSQGFSIHGERGLRRTFRELARSVFPDTGVAAPAWQ